MPTIAVEVSPSIAERFESATPSERRRLSLLVSLQLEAFLQRPPRDLGTVMDEAGRLAEANKLDAAKLSDLLEGDKDLLVLNGALAFEILTPRQALDRL